MSSVLYHYTCEHSHDAIGLTGTLLPVAMQRPELAADMAARHPGVAAMFGMVWATDLGEPDAEALGLTSLTMTCDRTAYRYAVPAAMFTRWGRLRSRCTLELVDALELSPGARPAHWWVALEPVPATYAPPR